MLVIRCICLRVHTRQTRVVGCKRPPAGAVTPHTHAQLPCLPYVRSSGVCLRAAGPAQKFDHMFKTTDSGGKSHERSHASSQAPAQASCHCMNAPDYDSEDDVCNGVQHVFNQKRETCKRKIYDELTQATQDIQDLDRRNASCKAWQAGQVVLQA